MTIRFACTLLTCCGTLFASDVERKRLEIQTTQSMRFGPAGEILVQGSFGELHVEGWDRPEVEITITKGTQKKYSLDDQEKALRYLNSVEVVAVGETPDRLVVSTSFPGRNLLTRPMRGKSNVNLSYKIRAPRHVTLSIQHDIGEVKVKDIAGNLRVTARIGEISLHLPQDENYTIHASTRIGEVDSDLPGHSGRKFLSDRFVLDESRAMRDVYVRVGIGAINIRKVQASKPPQRRELMALRELDRQL